VGRDTEPVSDDSWEDAESDAHPGFDRVKSALILDFLPVGVYIGSVRADDLKRLCDTMKKRRVIICVMAGLVMLVLCLTVVVFRSHHRTMSFHFLDGYEPERQSKGLTERGTYEYLRYHFKADYDTFSLAAKSELLSKGFQDITEPDRYRYARDYERRHFDQIRVEIRFAIARTDAVSDRPVYSWIDIAIVRVKPKFTFKNYWRYVRGKLAR